MAEHDHTISGLLTKRQELLNRSLDLRQQLAEVGHDIESVDRVLVAFGYQGELKGMTARSNRVVFFHRNELRRFCLEELRKATGPITSREIAEKICKLEGKDPRDHKLMLDMVGRVGKSLKLLRHQGVSESFRDSCGHHRWRTKPSPTSQK